VRADPLWIYEALYFPGGVPVQAIADMKEEERVVRVKRESEEAVVWAKREAERARSAGWGVAREDLLRLVCVVEDTLEHTLQHAAVQLR